MDNNYRDKKVAVIMGGDSAEREVSLRSGAAVLQALLERGYNAVKVDSATNVAGQLVAQRCEVAFIALHGRHGEDGTIQGLLEIMGIAYTGSGVLASALAIDKEMTKRQVAGQVTLADSVLVTADDDCVGLWQRCGGVAQVVKPVREGSTLGISIARDEAQLQAAIAAAREFDRRVLVEQYIDGREVTVAVVNGRALPVIEVVAASGFYDYAAKYTAGTTRYLVPAPLDDEVYSALQRDAERSFAALGCRGAARVDFIVAPGGNYFLEVNTIPGMTATSLLPKAAACEGMNFADLVELILADASLDR